MAFSFTPQRHLMELALQEAYMCRIYDEHPIGAVVAQGSRIISCSGNRTHRDLNAAHHAEVVAIGEASQLLGRKDLSDCVLYTTHEPCLMCAGASIYARVSGIVYGTSVKDVAHFVAQHPQMQWRSVHAPLDMLIRLSDKPDIQIREGFMRRQCLALFDTLLLPSSPQRSLLTVVPPAA